MKFTLIALPTRNIGNQFPNIGTIAIAQTVRDLGHEVNLIDVVRYGYSKDEVITKIDKFKPDLIGLSGIITSYYYFEPLSAMLKKSFPKIPLIVGGSLVSAIDLIEKYTEVDFLVKGEGESCITKLLSRVSSGQSLDSADIPGLFVRVGGKFRSPTIEQFYPELSDIPIPAYDLYDMEYYIKSSTYNVYRFLRLYPKIHQEIGDGVRFFSVVITRGCPFSCLFCYRLIKKHRHPPIDNVIKHLRMIKEKYGCSGISLLDELIIADKKWFIELCDTIASEVPGLRIFFGAGRVDLVTPEVISHAKKAGFFRFGCGIESGSQVILNNLHKRTTVEQNLNAIKLARDAEMMVTCNLFFGAPGENKQTLKETERFIQQNLDPCDYVTNFAYAYPGAPLFDYAIDNGILRSEQIHDYVLNASWGNCPLNFSDFSNGAELRRQVSLMQFRLKLRFMWKAREYRALVNLVLTQFILEAFYPLNKFCPKLAQTIRSIHLNRLQHKLQRVRVEVVP